MNRRRTVRHGKWLAVLFALLIWAQPGFPVVGGALAATKTTSAAAAASGPYATVPKPMTLAECGRCHPSQYGDLREHGGAHRFDCRNCHQIFHAYNPRLKNYAKIMPHCSECHDAPHGKKELDCLDCHQNPHEPLMNLPMSRLAKNCSVCHREQAEALRKSPSAHTNLGCRTCHSQKHGRIPLCTECHSPHYGGQDPATCTGCHPAHQPLKIAFAADANPKLCASCHDGVYAKWSTTKCAHGKVNCTVCHAKHGQIPKCTDCHTPPHDPKMLARFKSCLSCHQDAHDLATM